MALYISHSARSGGQGVRAGRKQWSPRGRWRICREEGQPGFGRRKNLKQKRATENSGHPGKEKKTENSGHPGEYGGYAERARPYMVGYSQDGYFFQKLSLFFNFIGCFLPLLALIHLLRSIFLVNHVGRGRQN